MAVHLLLGAALVAVPGRLFPPGDDPKPIDVVFYPSPAQAPPPPPRPLRSAPRPVAEPPPVAPLPERIATPPPPVVPPPRRARPPAPTPPPVPQRPAPRPAPERKVRTDLFDEPRPETRRARPPKPRTRTGGFAQDTAPRAEAERPRVVAQTDFGGAARVVAPRSAGSAAVTSTSFGEAQPERRARSSRRDTAIRSGGFADDAPRPTAPRRAAGTVRSGGFADAGSRSAAPTRARGTVVSGGFADGATERPAPASPAKVQQGQFGDGAPVARAPRKRERPTAEPDTPVEILSKPKPVYTDEARRLRVEGEVVLEVVFVASGRLRVVRVVGGLGHGLDEAAIEAARKIKFKPARRNGQPVDHAATLQIVFQLA